MYAICQNNLQNNIDSDGLAITISNSQNLNETSTSGGARGQVLHPHSVSVSCTSVYMLKVTGSFTLTMSVLGSSSTRWSARFSRYDSKWGSPRTNAREREATIAHENDHYQTYIAFETVLSTLNSMECKCCSQCGTWATTLTSEEASIYSAAVAHSQSFDTTTWWDGGNYSSHSFSPGSLSACPQ